MSEASINTDGRFTVDSMSGVAWWFKRWDTDEIPESWTLACDDPDCEHDDTCYLYNEPEQAESSERAVMVMVGDDREHVVDVSELTEISENDYCPGCGQTGCGHYR